MIHVAIVEDDKDICQTLALIIDGTTGYSCQKTFHDCETALPVLISFRPDVALMDINLPGMSGIEGVKKLKAALPDLDILMLTVQADDNSVFESLRAGASGYLIKSTPPAELLAAITEVHEGGAPMSTQIARKVLQSFHTSSQTPLSERETEILRQLCDGQNYKVIAENLFVSGHTIRTHIKNIYKKLHVNSRGQAVKKAMKDKLI
ncbi:MAG: response regulator transcription factor [Bacteroidia bacterium]|nr:response regulator transcription factor [Bacteroidia bacterium]